MEALEQKATVKTNAYSPPVSIIIEPCSNLTYTKLCVESLHKYTSHIDFELIMINNGSTGETAEYLNSLENVNIISFRQYSGTAKAFNEGMKRAKGEYILFTHDNIIFTKDWLDNLITCIKSSGKIGMVVPACNLNANTQKVGLDYNSLEEMYEVTKNYNASAPQKWEERLKLAACVFLTRKDAIEEIGGFAEAYFHCGFEEVDLCFRMRRSGYKLVFAKDTYIHHFDRSEIKDEFKNSNLLQADSKVFLTRFDVDAAADTSINQEVLILIDYNKSGNINILGIGSSCGGTVLQAQNFYKARGNPDVKLWYLTQEKKYITDLETVFDNVSFARIEEILYLYKDQKFDCVIIDKELQLFDNPGVLLKKIRSILKDDGQMFFSIANPYYYANIKSLINIRLDKDIHEAAKHCFSPEKLTMQLQKYGYAEINSYYIMDTLPAGDSELFEAMKSLSAITDKKLLELILYSKGILYTAKGNKDSGTVLLYPGYDFFLDDAFFDFNTLSVQLGIDVGKSPFAVLRDELKRRGYRFCTIDKGDIEDADYVIFIDVPKSYGNAFYRHIYHQLYKGKEYLDQCLNLKKKKNTVLILFMQEPRFVMPENYDRNILEYFDAVITMDDNLVDNKKFFKYHFSEPGKVENTYLKGFNGKKLLTLIDGNKASLIPGELYSKRREAIAYFENNHPDCFDFYGYGWQGCGYKNYKGPAPGKMEVLSRYKFCICFENGALNGYISEKIFDCFFSECVPIYLGAPNITDYIPGDTFIDMRRFGDYEEMYQFINSISEEEYNRYLSSIKDFLDSDKFAVFSHAGFAKNMADILEGLKK